MTVSDAVAERRSTRAFLPTPVPRDLLEHVLDKARFAPSGGNVQPWQAVIVAGEDLRHLFADFAARLQSGGIEADHPTYPDALPELWMTRRRQCAAQLYERLGIARGVREARDAQTARNWTGFGAPCMMFAHTPKFMVRAQWADMGIWLQTVMLLLQEEGLATCPQGAWAHAGGTVRQMLDIPQDHILYCGLAIGHADPDHPANRLRTQRAPLEESVRFMGF
jgi:nitroreductase